MGEINHPIGPWAVMDTTEGHGVYEKGWGFVAIHKASGLSHWEEGQARRRALMIASHDMLTALETVLAGGHLNTGEQAIVANAIAKATGRNVVDVVKGS